jgi:hypothetical protein
VTPSRLRASALGSSNRYGRASTRAWRGCCRSGWYVKVRTSRPGLEQELSDPRARVTERPRHEVRLGATARLGRHASPPGVRAVCRRVVRRSFGRGTAGARVPRVRSPCAATPRHGSGSTGARRSEGRVGHTDARRRTPLNGLICRRFSFRRWLRSAWLSHSSDRRFGHEWATESCLQRQRPARRAVAPASQPVGFASAGPCKHPSPRA